MKVKMRRNGFEIEAEMSIEEFFTHMQSESMAAAAEPKKRVGRPPKKKTDPKLYGRKYRRRQYTNHRKNLGATLFQYVRKKVALGYTDEQIISDIFSKTPELPPRFQKRLNMTIVEYILACKTQNRVYQRMVK